MKRGEQSQASVREAAAEFVGSDCLFPAPVVFVAIDLKRRWPEISGRNDYVDLESVPASRLHLVENIWIVSTYLRLPTASEGGWIP